MPPKKRVTRTTVNKTKATPGLFARRGLMLIVALFVVIAAGFGMYKLGLYVGSKFLTKNPHFELKTVDARSDGRLTPVKLIEYADVQLGMSLFDVDFDLIRKHLKSVPLIESVQIRRDLPDTLSIHAIERVAAAQIRWSVRGMPFLIDRTGVILPATRSGQALPLIEGLTFEKLRPGETVDDVGVLYILEIISACDVLGLGAQVRFERFDLRYPDFITVSLNEGVTARFPRHSARDKLIRLVRVLQIAREQGLSIKTIDLTPDGRNVPTTYQ